MAELADPDADGKMARTLCGIAKLHGRHKLVVQCGDKLGRWVRNVCGVRLWGHIDTARACSFSQELASLISNALTIQVVFTAAL